MAKKFSFLVTALIVMLAPLVGNIRITNAAADICTWTGAVDANWSNGGNWSGCDNGGVPENGDALRFNSTDIGTSNNDIVGLSIDALYIDAAGHTLNGNALTITSATTIVSSTGDASSVTIGLDLSFTGFNAGVYIDASSTIIFNGGISLSNGGGTYFGGTSSGGVAQLNGVISGSTGTFQVRNGRTLEVYGANTFTASTVGAESNATFECRSTGCFGDNANDIYMGGGIVALYVSATYSNDWQTSVTTPDSSWLSAYENISITGNGVVNDAIGISQEVSGRSLQFTGTITNTSAISLFTVDTTAFVRVDGAVSGAGGFSIGGGSFRLAGASTYSGTNTINSGAIVSLTNASGLGDNTGATNVLSGGSLQFNFAAPVSVDEPILLNGSGVTSSGALVNLDASTTLVNTVTLSSDTLVKVDSGFLNFDGVIDGTGNLTIDSLNTSNYASLNAVNTYTGTTTVYGAVGLDETGAVPGDLIAMGDVFIYPSANEVVGGGLTMTTVGADSPHWDQPAAITNTFTSISGDGSMLIDGAGSSIEFDQNTDTTYAGSFTGSNGTVTKSGTGTLTLTGSCSDSSKLLSVVQGELVLNTATNNCQVDVSGGTLKGVGSAGAVTVDSGATLSPGNSPGCMTVASLTLNSGSTLYEEIAGPATCVENDMVTVTGTADITGASLDIRLSYLLDVNTSMTIITAGSVVGTFNGLPDGATFNVLPDGFSPTLNWTEFRINYTPTSVILTVVGNNLTLADTGVNLIPTIIVASMTMVIVLGLAISTRRRVGAVDTETSTNSTEDVL